MDPLRIVRLTVVLGSYNYGTSIFGETMTKEEAEKTAEQMQGKNVSGEFFLGLPMESRFGMYGRYTIVKTYLYDIPGSDRGAGLILADCESADDLGQAILRSQT